MSIIPTQDFGTFIPGKKFLQKLVEYKYYHTHKIHGNCYISPPWLVDFHGFPTSKYIPVPLDPSWDLSFPAHDLRSCIPTPAKKRVLWQLGCHQNGLAMAWVPIPLGVFRLGVCETTLTKNTATILFFPRFGCFSAIFLQPKMAHSWYIGNYSWWLSFVLAFYFWPLTTRWAQNI